MKKVADSKVTRGMSLLAHSTPLSFSSSSFFSSRVCLALWHSCPPFSSLPIFFWLFKSHFLSLMATEDGE